MDGQLSADWETVILAEADGTARNARIETLRCFLELHDRLRRYLIRVGAAPMDADDAVQETFLRLYRHMRRNGHLSNPCGWVYRVARNYLRDERRNSRSRHTVPLDDSIVIRGNPTDCQYSPEQYVLADERMRRLRVAIERLPEPKRECFLLRSSGLPYSEIANIMGINTSLVGTMVHRAVARLRDDLS